MLDLIKKWFDAHNHYILAHLSKHGLTKNGQSDNYHNSRHEPEPHRNPEILIKLNSLMQDHYCLKSQTFVVCLLTNETLEQLVMNTKSRVVNIKSLL